MCIGLDDHLPCEMTAKNGGQYSHSDYSAPSNSSLPEAVLQPASSIDKSNSVSP